MAISIYELKSEKRLPVRPSPLLQKEDPTPSTQSIIASGPLNGEQINNLHQTIGTQATIQLLRQRQADYTPSPVLGAVYDSTWIQREAAKLKQKSPNQQQATQEPDQSSSTHQIQRVLGGKLTLPQIIGTEDNWASTFGRIKHWIAQYNQTDEMNLGRLSAIEAHLEGLCIRWLKKDQKRDDSTDQSERDRRTAKRDAVKSVIRSLSAVKEKHGARNTYIDVANLRAWFSRKHKRSYALFREFAAKQNTLENFLFIERYIEYTSVLSGSDETLKRRGFDELYHRFIGNAAPLQINVSGTLQAGLVEGYEVVKQEGNFTDENIREYFRPATIEINKYFEQMMSRFGASKEGDEALRQEFAHYQDIDAQEDIETPPLHKDLTKEDPGRLKKGFAKLANRF
ncbi:MAG: hypothetical protein AAF639_07445 [Chloroflexota bacterium]